MLAPMETTSVGEVMAAEGASLEVSSVELHAKVSNSPRLPRPRPTPTTEGPKEKKDKQKAAQLVHLSCRRHP